MLTLSLWNMFLNFPHLAHKVTSIFQPPAGISERKVVSIFSSSFTICSTENCRNGSQHLHILQDADTNMHLALSTLVMVCKSVELFTCLLRQVLEPFIGLRLRKLPLQGRTVCKPFLSTGSFIIACVQPLKPLLLQTTFGILVHNPGDEFFVRFLPS